MINNIFKKIVAARKSFATYNIGLIQTKAHRVMKSRTDDLLKEFEISSVEWALLGLLHDNSKGLKFIDTAEMLGVEAPFITILVEKLSEKKLLTQITSKTDRRAKTLLITEHGNKLVPLIEDKLRKGMGSLVEGIPVGEIYSYYKVLTKIVSNSEKANKQQ